MARVRVRQHVNPLSHKYSKPIALPNWEQIYSQINQPLHLDIGCARGKFLLKMAPLYPQINFLGVEIRESLVVEANNYRDRAQLSNLHFLFGNINLFSDALLNAFPRGVLQWVTIQFPDPWFKNYHRKRRVVQPELVNTLAQSLPDGGMVFLQSDVKAVAIEMGDRFLANAYFEKQHSETWLADNPFPIATEREISTLDKNEPVYRLVLRKKSV